MRKQLLNLSGPSHRLGRRLDIATTSPALTARLSTPDIKSVECKSVSISLSCDLIHEFSKIAYKNMRKGVESKSVSAIVRQALEAIGYKAN